MHEKMHPTSHFFDDQTLAFFGESLRTMKVLDKTTEIIDAFGRKHHVYQVSSLQKKHPEGPKRQIFYFDDQSYDYITE